MVKNTRKIQTLTELKRLRIGTKIKLVGSEGFSYGKCDDFINEIIGKSRVAFELEYGWLTFPDPKCFESWDRGFIVKQGIETSIPTILKFEVFDGI